MAETLQDYFTAFEAARRFKVNHAEAHLTDLEWDTTQKRELLREIRTWIYARKLKSGIVYPKRLANFALTHRQDITVYLVDEPTGWQVHWHEEGKPKQQAFLSNAACWEAIKLIPYETIAWDVWRLAQENGWLPPTIELVLE